MDSWYVNSISQHVANQIFHFSLPFPAPLQKIIHRFYKAANMRTVVSLFSFCHRRCIQKTQKALLHTSSRRSVNWCKGDLYANPVKDLESLSQVPLIRKEDKVFEPSKEVMIKAESCFKTSGREKIEPLKGIIDLSNLPQHDLSEVCVALFRILLIWLSSHGSY